MSWRVSQLHSWQLPLLTGEESSACFSFGEDGGSDIDKSQPSSWNKEQVYTWVCHALNVGPNQLAFLKHSIEAWAVDGAKLLFLTREDLCGTLRLRDGALVDALVPAIDQLRVLDETLNQLAALRLLMDDAASVPGMRHSGIGLAAELQMEELRAQEQITRGTLAALRLAQDTDLALQLDLAEQQFARDHELALSLHLEEGGELESPLCNPVNHTQAYLPAEVNLAKLEALLNNEAASTAQASAGSSAWGLGAGAAREQGVEPNGRRERTGQSQTVWASGTGFGSLYSKEDVWDPKKSEAAQAAADAEMEAVLSELVQSLEPAIRTRAEYKKSPLAEPVDVTATLAAVEDSCLIPYLRKQLAHSSFQDMCKRSAFYSSVVTLVGVLCCPSLAHLIVRGVPAEGSLPPLLDVLEQVNDGAEQFERVAALAEVQGVRGTATSFRDLGRFGKGKEPKEVLEERQRCQQLAKLIGHVLEKAKALVPDLPSTSSGTWASSKRTRSAASTASSVPAESADMQYVQELKSLKVDHSAGIVDKHHFAGKAKAEGCQPVARTVRLAKEISSLKKDLPLNAQSSIFVRFDEQNFNLWKALIVGPEGTPYEGGLFEFDIYFPPTYPDEVPKVHFCTTGGGRVRMNPNLYECGKVCLSLLGTWSGSKGENWDPTTSTALQVLVSIQSLILVDMPWYNEPGYESRTDTKVQAMEYNLNIRKYTLQWAVCGYLKHPPVGFEEVVKKHFRLRGDKLLATYQVWASEGEAGLSRHPDGTDVKVRTAQSRESIERHLAEFRNLLKDL